jgi:sugar phosphate permease
LTLSGTSTLFDPRNPTIIVAVWSDPYRRRWIAWGALTAVFLLVNVYRLSTAVLAGELMAAFDATGAALGTLHASFFYVYAALQLPAGVLADQVGIRQTATVGTVVMGLGVVAFAFSDTYHVAFVARGLIGLGGSVVFITTLRFCANWFHPTEFATMNGLTLAVAGLGGMFATRPLAVAVAVFGWRLTLLGLGIVGLALAPVVAVLVRNTPTAAGLPDIEGVPAMPTLTLRDVGVNLHIILVDRETVLVGLILFCGTGMNITLFGLWGVPYVVQTYGLSVTRASTYTLLGSAGLFVGPPVIGLFSDRLGQRTPLMVAGGVVYVGAFGVLTLMGTPPLAVVGVVFFVIGTLTGAFGLGYPVVKERHASATSGVATGTVNMAAFTGAAVFPTIMGAILDAYWTGETVAGVRVYTLVGYRIAFAFATTVGAAALGCTMWLHVRKHYQTETPIA